MDTLEKVIDIIANNYSSVGMEIAKSSNLKDDLGLDSLTIDHLVYDIEESFGIPEHRCTSFEHIKTVEDIADVIDTLLLEHGAERA